MNCKVFGMLLASLALSSCIAQEPKDISLDDVAIMINNNDVQNDGVVQSQLADVITGARCLEALSFLMKEDPKEYNEFADAYHNIAEGYRFLNENSAGMDQDAREMYSMSLSMKKDLLCSKLRFAGFQRIKEKINF